MTEHRGDPTDVRADATREGVASRAPRVALGDVGHQHDASRCPAEDAGCIHRAGIAAPASSQVDTITGPSARDEVGRGYGAEEVPEAGCGEEADDAHEGRMMRVRTLVRVAGVGALVWSLVVRGSLTLDLGVGRRVRPLGPIALRIAAPREVVFDVVAAPYLGRTPRALRSKLEVLERGEDLVLAAHYTPAYGLTATTVETVRFERPERVHFRLLRGPVPHVLETFELHELGAETELVYTGELGTDLWLAGQLWGAAVARTWEATVRTSLDGIRAEAERRTRRR